MFLLRKKRRCQRIEWRHTCAWCLKRATPRRSVRAFERPGLPRSQNILLQRTRWQVAAWSNAADGEVEGGAVGKEAVFTPAGTMFEDDLFDSVDEVRQEAAEHSSREVEIECERCEQIEAQRHAGQRVAEQAPGLAGGVRSVSNDCVHQPDRCMLASQLMVGGCMMKFLFFLTLLVIPEVASATGLFAIDCVTAQLNTAATFIFDTDHSLVQFVPKDGKPIFNASYGNIYPADVTDAALTIHVTSFDRKPVFDLQLSRLTGTSNYNGLDGNSHRLDCTTSKDKAQFLRPIITESTDRIIGISCSSIYSGFTGEKAGKVLREESAIIVANPQTKQGLIASGPLSQPGQQEPLAVLEFGPDFFRLCAPTNCTKKDNLLVNRFTGSVFGLDAFSDKLVVRVDDQQLLCKNFTNPNGTLQK
jgi:hypothetical protein